MGNPFTLGDIQPGYNVLDIGSGAGFNLYIAKRLTGESGKVCGKVYSISRDIFIFSGSASIFSKPFKVFFFKYGPGKTFS